MSLAARLYRGEVSYDYIGHRRRWYALSLAIVIIALASIGIRGFNFGIDFKGGSSFQFNANGHTVADARSIYNKYGIDDAVITELKDINGSRQIRIESKELDLNVAPGAKISQNQEIEDALAGTFHVTAANLNPALVGSSWGSQITDKALQGLVIFLVLVVLYIALRFEPKMASAAIIALIHDLVITAGIYALVGFEVTPSTVIAVLTILGFSLYDTVVVFDKVRENTAGIGSASRTTYSQAANLAVNQTIMRSINTSMIALLPVAALLFVGAGLLGAGTLKDLALAQFIGLASGAYSSIFVATPLLCDFKEREPKMKELTAKVERARAKGDPAVTGAPEFDHQGALLTRAPLAVPTRQRSHRDNLRTSGTPKKKPRKGGPGRKR